MDLRGSESQVLTKMPLHSIIAVGGGFRSNQLQDTYSHHKVAMMKNEENYYNFIVRLGMTPQEMEGFSKVLPLVGLSMSPGESNMISRILGYPTVSDLQQTGFDENPFLRNAFAILSFLYVSRNDPFTFNDFYQRLIFCDKDVERKVKRVLHIGDETDCMSAERLDLMYLLETDKDEWDDTDAISH